MNFILIRRNTPGVNIHQIIADFKSCPLDPEEERRINEEIKKCKDYEADVDRLKQEIGDVKENVTEMQKSLDEVNENVTKVDRDLDDVTGIVTEMKSDFDDVKENVTEVKSDLDGMKKNVTEVKSDLDDVKENAAEVKRDFDEVKGKVTEVKRDLDDVKGNVMNVQKDLDDVTKNVIEVKSDLDDVKEIFTEVKSDLEDVKESIFEVKSGIDDVKENATEVKRDLNDVKVNVTEVKRDLDEVKENVTEVKIGFDEVKGNVIKVEKGLEEVKRRQQTEIDSRKDFPKQTEEEKYQTRKKELKDGLIEFYKTRHSKIFLSPLFDENDTPLASFYIRPALNLIISAPMRNDEKTPVESLSAMFKTENEANREIYVIADAGLGKTAFSNYLAITWCQAHFPDEKMTQSFEKDDIDCMQGFDFLFLVLLRDSNDLCSIDDLILKKIVSNVGVQEKPSEDFLLKILKNEKCLVILDGLDEWTHPEKECHRSPRAIPHRNDREKCTILTTTRPWKLGVLNLNSCQIEKKVELTKLSYKSAVTLTERILQRLKSYPNKDALQLDVTAYITGIESSQNDELISVPLLLIYTICLWCDGVQIGNSKCELYINIVELLFSRTIQKHGNLQQLCDLSESDIPKCFAKYENCTKCSSLLMCLGKLAYLTLFNETKETTLVFDRSVAEKYLSIDEMNFTLNAGVLSESTSKTLTKKFSKVSFSHKTVQEFFAAIFISSENEAQKTVVETCRNAQVILDMSKIYEFISKMNSNRMCVILNDLKSVINEDEKTYGYRIMVDNNYATNNNPLYAIQKMYMSCLQEMPESENIQLCLQDFFIDHDTMHNKQLQRLLKQNKTNIKSLNINISRTSSSLREIIDLFSLSDLSHIHKLYYCGDNEKEAEINRIFVSQFAARILKSGKWTNDFEENLSKNMARCQNLQYLQIHNFALSHKNTG
ncbi:uncharacterized protein LOC132738514, partial [Ruditapes philippinarum]|uniref:uncharacterized protein LOC132738514 n=1 Tax=Ruditapes philippinarum TaxID=129788 RepID=UPI00295B6533